MKFLNVIMLIALCSLTTFQLNYGYVTQIYTLTIQNQLKTDVTVNATYDYSKGTTNLSTEVIVPAGSTINIIRKGNDPYLATLQKIVFTTTGSDGKIIGQEIPNVDLTKQRVILVPQQIASSGFKINAY